MTADSMSTDANGKTPSLSDQQREAIEQIKQLANRRHEAERVANETRDTGLTETEREHAESLKAIEDAHRTGLLEAKQRREKAIHQAESMYEIGLKSAHEAHQTRLKKIQDRASHQSKETKDNLEFGQWIAESVYEANQQQPREQFLARKSTIDDTSTALEETARLSSRTLRRYWQPGINITGLDDVPASENPTHTTGMFREMK